jgi:hypothetical protein
MASRFHVERHHSRVAPPTMGRQPRLDTEPVSRCRLVLTQLPSIGLESADIQSHRIAEPTSGDDLRDHRCVAASCRCRRRHAAAEHRRRIPVHSRSQAGSRPIAPQTSGRSRLASSGRLEHAPTDLLAACEVGSSTWRQCFMVPRGTPQASQGRRGRPAESGARVSPQRRSWIVPGNWVPVLAAGPASGNLTRGPQAGSAALRGSAKAIAGSPSLDLSSRPTEVPRGTSGGTDLCRPHVPSRESGGAGNAVASPVARLERHADASLRVFHDPFRFARS